MFKKLYNAKIKNVLLFFIAALIFSINLLFINSTDVSGQSTLDVYELLYQHNQVREEIGELQPLKLNARLNYSAKQKAQAMLETSCWDHYCPDGKSPWKFFDEAGYIYLHAGENLAHGYFDIDSLMNAWMNSPTHRENIMKEEFNEIGFGIIQGDFRDIEDNLIIAVHFGSRTNKESEIISTSDDIRTDSNIKIVYPLTNEYYKDPNLELRGETNLEKVDITHNNRDRGETQVIDGVFTYRPTEPFNEGLQIVEVRNGNDKDKVNFIIDVQPPKIIGDNIFVDKNSDDNQLLTISFTPSESLESAFLLTDGSKVSFQEKNNSYEAVLDKQSFNEIVEFQIQISDLAGNSEIIVLRNSDIKGLSLVNNRVSEEVFSSSIDNFIPNTPYRAINFGFVVILLILTIIDIYSLHKTGLTKSKGKPYLHLGVVIIMLIVIIIGGTRGQLIEGISSL